MVVSFGSTAFPPPLEFSGTVILAIPIYHKRLYRERKRELTESKKWSEGEVDREEKERRRGPPPPVL